MGSGTGRLAVRPPALALQSLRLPVALALPRAAQPEPEAAPARARRGRGPRRGRGRGGGASAWRLGSRRAAAASAGTASGGATGSASASLKLSASASAGELGARAGGDFSSDPNPTRSRRHWQSTVAAGGWPATCQWPGGAESESLAAVIVPLASDSEPESRQSLRLSHGPARHHSRQPLAGTQLEPASESSPTPRLRLRNRDSEPASESESADSHCTHWHSNGLSDSNFN